MTSNIQPVVGIVGGGPIGLSLSLQLGRLGIRSILLERSASATDHPKARGTWPRTMELFRLWGIEDVVRKNSLPVGTAGFAFVETISGREFGRAMNVHDYSESPTPACSVSQDIVESALFAAASESPLSEVLYSHEFLSHRDVEGGIEMTGRDLKTGEEKTWLVRYLAAADGAGSGLRKELGIEMTGTGVIYTACNDFWQADLSHIKRTSQVGDYRVSTGVPGIPIATVLSTNCTDRWLTISAIGKANERDPRPWSDEEVVKHARAHTGISNLDVKIINRSV
jgi:2-polyprenyl-6-methoxyphenol hydroxylase-like FAD-dependent oxidoreductase